MNSYWKQSLWIGGIYWIISQCFAYVGTYWSSLTDTAISVLLLLFLIPMKWLQPFGKIDCFIRRNPVISTLLVSVGWVPYVVAIIFVVNVIAAFVIVLAGPQYEYHLFTLFKVIITATDVRHVVTILTIIAAVFMVLVRHKSIAGDLDKRYKLVANCQIEKKHITTEKTIVKAEEDTEKVRRHKTSTQQPAKKIKKAAVSGKVTKAKTAAKKMNQPTKLAKKGKPASGKKVRSNKSAAKEAK